MIPFAVELEPAYVLESRPYKESSLIVKLLTLHFGIVSLLAKGAKSPKNTTRSLLQAFCPIEASWRGRNDLKNLTSVESSPHRSGQFQARLKGDYLYAGFYANELLVRLVPPGEPYTALFAFYNELIGRFYENQALAPCLREFEWHLISELGYGLNLYTDMVSGKLIESGKYYVLSGVDGFVQSNVAPANSGFLKGELLKGELPKGELPKGELAKGELFKGELFKGEELLAIREGEYASQAGITAKRLFRYVIEHYLGGRPLKSREIYIKMREIKNGKSD
ncbi:MAG: DNA repair protein RecO [Proteobacteria bacterium]|nr:MAG: DNA repair protein RecO [Pseudomonadota bacterium]PIE40425.1 MAG: DNA repair protein RecO [Gammaproteobacteria bacterium]